MNLLIKRSGLLMCRDYLVRVYDNEDNCLENGTYICLEDVVMYREEMCHVIFESKEEYERYVHESNEYCYKEEQ
jgi:hypothetical protein